jgi:hypothetical protein
MLLRISQAGEQALDVNMLKAVRDLTLSAERLNLVAKGAFDGLRDILDHAEEQETLDSETQSRMMKFMALEAEKFSSTYTT